MPQTRAFYFLSCGLLTFTAHHWLELEVGEEENKPYGQREGRAQVVKAKNDQMYPELTEVSLYGSNVSKLVGQE